MNNFAERLEKRRIQLGLSKTEIWKGVGVSSGMYSQWLNNSKPSGENLIKLSVVLKTTPEWLSLGKVENKARQDAASYQNEIDLDSNEDFPSVRRVTLSLSAGHTGFAIETDYEDKSPIVFAKEWFTKNNFKPSTLITTKVRGNSMQPYLYEGDTVVINTADTALADGVVFAVNYEGEPIIKRLVRDAGAWWLSSDNSDQRKHPRKECQGDGCILIGRIVHKQSMVI